LGSLVDKLTEKKAIAPPSHLKNTIQYETIMGSVAYGVSSDVSDTDIYGFSIPPRRVIFPHLAGEITGFGTQIPRFEQYQEHHVPDPNGKKDQDDEIRTYDLTIFNIVKFFQLLMENNPNMIDSIFTPQRCVLHCTSVGEMVRSHRRMFLHKGAFHKFKGYAYSQLHKADIKTPRAGSKRAVDVEKHGFDVKFSYHVVRLIDECDQILNTHDLDLERSRETLKAIRRGEWTLERVKEYFEEKERYLEQCYANSTLPHKPDEAAIKTLLLECLEAHYGSLKEAVVVPTQEKELLAQIKALCEKAGV
jgi:predicted nucleotidyltransferase